MKELGIQRISLDEITENPDNSAVYGDLDLPDDFLESIKQTGIMQPPIVTPRDGQFVIVSGHRRLAAAKVIGLEEVDCLVREYDSDDEMEYDFIASNKSRHKTFKVMLNETIRFLNVSQRLCQNTNSLDGSELDEDAVRFVRNGLENEAEKTAGKSYADIAAEIGNSKKFVAMVNALYSDAYREQYISDVIDSGKKITTTARKAFVKAWDKVRVDIRDEKVTLNAAYEQLVQCKREFLGEIKQVKTPKPKKAPVKVVDLAEGDNHIETAINHWQGLVLASWADQGEDESTRDFHEFVRWLAAHVPEVDIPNLARLMVDYAEFVVA